MKTAIEILDEFADPNDMPLQYAKTRIIDFVKVLMKKHRPLRGEAYPLDKDRYCSICMSSDGGSSRYPCSTIKAVRKFLKNE